MKKLMSMIMVMLLSVSVSIGQSAIPNINIKSLEGEYISAVDVLNPEGHTILFFWSMDDDESLRLINDLSEAWDTKKEKGSKVKIVGICVNPNTRADMVKPYIYGNDVQFANYIDENGELRRAMNISAVPFTLLLDKGNQMVFMHNGYCPGIPEFTCDQIVNLNNGSAVNRGKLTMLDN